MFCAFFTLLTAVAGIGTLVWLGWRRVRAHLKAHPEAARALTDHLITPLLLGGEEVPPPAAGPGETAGGGGQ
jgi:hypothetical protein